MVRQPLDLGIPKEEKKETVDLFPFVMVMVVVTVQKGARQRGSHRICQRLPELSFVLWCVAWDRLITAGTVKAASTLMVPTSVSIMYESRPYLMACPRTSRTKFRHYEP